MRAPPPNEPYDIVIAGGGLAGSLIALALSARRPEVSVALVEAGPQVGGNHVWSFFATDVAEADRALVETLCAARWEAGYDVHFPAFSRHLPTPYRSMTSENLAAAVADALPSHALHTGSAVAALAADGVTLADGTTVAGKAVIDARGLDPELLAHLRGGWQKFAGAMLRCHVPHGASHPVVMDARVDQAEGYRFVYCLPFSATEIFVEDTYYSDTPDLDREVLLARIAEYAAAQGWQVAETTRIETGVLPVVSDGDFAAFWPAEDRVARAGVRAGLLQPLTSYSLPDAVRMASAIAALPRLDARSLGAFTRAYAKAHWRQGLFYRLLSRMLFGASAPPARYRMLQRFYGLDAQLIERFYKGQSTWADKARIMAGKPPVPVLRAAQVLAGKGAPPHLVPATPAIKGNS